MTKSCLIEETIVEFSSPQVHAPKTTTTNTTKINDKSMIFEKANILAASMMLGLHLSPGLLEQLPLLMQVEFVLALFLLFELLFPLLAFLSATIGAGEGLELL